MQQQPIVADRFLFAVALIIITLACQVASLNTSWYRLEANIDEVSLDEPSEYDKTKVIQSDLLDERITTYDNNQRSVNSFSNTESYSNSSSSEYETNQELVGTNRATVFTKQITYWFHFAAITMTAVSLLFVLLRTIVKFESPKMIRAPTAIAIMLTGLILVIFPIIFQPTSDESIRESENDDYGFSCEFEETGGIPKLFETVELSRCNVTSTSYYDIEGSGRISTGYFLELLSLLFLMVTSLYLNKKKKKMLEPIVHLDLSTMK
jgi:hypothetical protein